MSILQYKKNKLVFGESEFDLSQITKDYEKPIYIYDLSFIKKRFLLMQQTLQDFEIYYAMKANSNLEVLRLLNKLGCSLDVVSGGEIKRGLDAGFLPDKIIYSGVGKTKSELELALELNIRQINVESLPELIRIIKIAKQKKTKASIVLRLNPDVDIQTHPYIATGLKENKFGMELSLLPELIKKIEENSEHLYFKGISLHLGSQMHELTAFNDAILKLKPIFIDLQKRFPDFNVFDVGGGLGIKYEKQEFNYEEDLLKEYFQICSKNLNFKKIQLQTEPGRWIVGHAGVLLAQVQYVKSNMHKDFVIIDSGMNHLMRPSLYQAYHEIWPLINSEDKIMVDVVGPICESADSIAQNRLIAKVTEDDFLVIADVGAYGFSMANQYNLHEFPKEICIG